jgi:hypothetical protein
MFPPRSIQPASFFLLFHAARIHGDGGDDEDDGSLTIAASPDYRLSILFHHYSLFL